MRVDTAASPPVAAAAAFFLAAATLAGWVEPTAALPLPHQPAATLGGMDNRRGGCAGRAWNLAGEEQHQRRRPQTTRRSVT